MGMMTEMQTQAVNAAAAGAGGFAALPPYPATSQQLVNQFQAAQLQPGRTLLATIDPSNPAAIRLDFGSLR